VQAWQAMNERGPSRDVLLWTVVVANLAYLALLALRIAASRLRGTTTAASAPGAPEPVARRHVVSHEAAGALVAISTTATVYYVALLLWLLGFDPGRAPLIQSTWLLYRIGVVLSVGGLTVMGWTYLVFRSWRWRAEISPGHRLMTGGPFRHIRHPIYLAFALFYFGSFFLLPYAVFLVHAIASFAAYDYRARIEERVMLEAFGDDFRLYRARTRRFVPGLY
jgi:protein-S-isoprenylcysteine O-methyltransferase Ste14